jgi:DNA-binding FadR family transcriptional regulator
MAKKMAQQLADQIGREILDEQLTPGTLLGSEMELNEKYGCSRAVFREAIRLLEHHGIATMRRGVGGGLYVSNPEPEHVADAMAVYLDFNGVKPSQLEEARRAIETVCVETLARTVTEDDIEQIRRFLADEARAVAEGELQSMHDFHVLIAELTKNPALKLFVDSLTNLTMRQRTSDSRNRKYLDVVHKAHTKIAEAIIARDPSLARHRMISHLEAVSASWEPRESGKSSARFAVPAEV